MVSGYFAGFDRLLSLKRAYFKCTREIESWLKNKTKKTTQDPSWEGDSTEHAPPR